MQRNESSMLFLHGLADTFTPTGCVYAPSINSTDGNVTFKVSHLVVVLVPGGEAMGSAVCSPERAARSRIWSSWLQMLKDVVPYWAQIMQRSCHLSLTMALVWSSDFVAITATCNSCWCGWICKGRGHHQTVLRAGEDTQRCPVWESLTPAAALHTNTSSLLEHFVWNSLLLKKEFSPNQKIQRESTIFNHEKLCFQNFSLFSLKQRQARGQATSGF